MSGGSMNYLYAKLDYDATFDKSTPERKAFAKHLVKVSKALHDIEWVDSADYADGDDTEAILACLGETDVLRSCIDDAEQILESLTKEISKAKTRINA